MNRIDKAIDNLLIKSDGEIRSRIEQISFDVVIENTESKMYCYCLKIDGNGNVRMNDLVDYIDEKIVEYAIPKKELDEAGEYYMRTKSFSKVHKLRKKASNYLKSEAMVDMNSFDESNYEWKEAEYEKVYYEFLKDNSTLLNDVFDQINKDIALLRKRAEL